MMTQNMGPRVDAAAAGGGAKRATTTQAADRWTTESDASRREREAGRGTVWEYENERVIARQFSSRRIITPYPRPQVGPSDVPRWDLGDRVVYVGEGGVYLAEKDGTLVRPAQRGAEGVQEEKGEQGGEEEGERDWEFQEEVWDAETARRRDHDDF